VFESIIDMILTLLLNLHSIRSSNFQKKRNVESARAVSDKLSVKDMDIWASMIDVSFNVEKGACAELELGKTIYQSF